MDRDDGVTVGETIDGWRDQKVDPMRIDLVFSSAEGTTLSGRVIFNGVNRPVISDHLGVRTQKPSGAVLLWSIRGMGSNDIRNDRT